MTTTQLLGITTHTTVQQAVEQETIPHSRTIMAPVIRYILVLVAGNITPIVAAIRFMYQRDEDIRVFYIK